MAARRIAKSAVDWTAFAERVPANQRDFFRAFKAKSESIVNRVHQYPESLPKLDFSFYKARLANPAVAEQFEKQYQNVSVPFPKDKNNLLQEVDTQEKKAEADSKAFVGVLQGQIKEARMMLDKLGSIPPPDQMTHEMYAYYFPDKSLDPVSKPTFWPHIPMLQPGHKDHEYIK
uniref:ATP synthase subunit d, mitochondrial n=1 Tax=Haliotis discus discus TaxID=91233 RepID=B6RB53_HALDI|nr:putative mitochondrial ATP synthase [Haliotis discus discus]